jgi:hypothetical protein
MTARYVCTFAMLIALAACSGKERPFGDGPIEQVGGSSGIGSTTVEPGSAGTGPGSGPEPAATEGGPVEGIPVDTLSRPDDTSQSSGSLACEADPSACTSPDAGPVPAACIPTGPRDCTSDADNDCDGQPDSSIDAVCACVSGTSEPCDEHPGLDGQGQCRAGLRTCVLDEVNLTTAWSGCEGAVGPGVADSCEPGDDIDCDGTPNEGCSCVDGQTQPCGSNTNNGPCQIGTSACVDGRFGPCVGAVAPANADSCSSRTDDSNCNGIPFDGCSCVNGDTQSCGMTDTGACQLGTRTCVNGAFGQCVGQVNPRSRDCRSQQDNDCDGRPDNTIDNVCECVPGGGNGPCSDDPNNSRCNDQGRCAPCQADSDCSFIGGGRQFCSRTAGQCVARFACGDASPPGPTVVPEFGLFSEAAPSTGGTILDGEYVQTVAYGTNIPTTFPAFVIGQSFAFRGQFVHWRGVEFLYEEDPGGPLWDRIGTYSTSGNSITIDWFQCADIFGPSSSGSTTMQYAASPTTIELIGTSSGRFLRR